LVHD
jgi:hypothetical protein